MQYILRERKGGKGMSAFNYSKIKEQKWDSEILGYIAAIYKGADSVDFALVNRVKPGDLVVTQDYGLASMCLARCARVLNQNGLEYTADNMDALMLRRYENKKLLRAGKHPKGSAKRTKEQDMKFSETLKKILNCKL